MSPIVPFWLLFVVTAGTILLAVWSYQLSGLTDQRARLILFLFRLSSFLLLVLIAGNIQWTNRGSILKKPVVKLFLDNSLSSAYHQSVSKESLLNGYEQLVSSVRSLTHNKASEARVDVFTFGESVQLLDGSPLSMSLDEASTNISSLLSSASETVGDEQLSALILVTDGQTTVGTEPTGETFINVPVHTIGIGESLRMVDVTFSKIQVPTVVVSGEDIVAEVTVESFGAIDQRVHVSLEGGGELLGTHVISPRGDGSSQNVRFQFRADEIGEKEYELRISSLKDEINIENNRYPFSLTVLKDRFKVAMITGAPSFNTRFLKLALAEQKNIQVDHFTQVQDAWMPTIADFWRQPYDLIILDNFPINATPQRWAPDLEQKLKRDNTAVALVAGANVRQSKLLPFLPMLGVQPIKEEDGGMEPLFLGSAPAEYDPMRYFDFEWGSLPPLAPHLFIEPGDARMETVAFLSGTPRTPLLLVGKIDLPSSRGKFSRRTVFTSAYLWHLYFRSQASESNKKVLLYWTELLKWLTTIGGEDDRYFRMTKSTYQRGEEVSIEGTFSRLTQDQRTKGVWWRVQHSETGEQLIPLAADEQNEMWRGTFIAAEPGKYRFWALIGDEQHDQREPHGEFRVEQAMLELKNVSLNRELLESLSASTGGHYFPWSQKERVIEDISVSGDKVLYSRTVNISHWPPLLILLLILLGSEWVLRRSQGLQ